MSDKKVVIDTIKTLKEEGYLIEKSPLYVEPQKHKDHHDWLDDIMPWARDISNIFRKRVISAMFFLFVIVVGFLAWLATDIKNLIPPKFK